MKMCISFILIALTGFSLANFSGHASQTASVAANQLVLKYGTNGSDVHVIIKRESTGWGAFGFGSTGMVGADIVTCENSSGTITCHDCFTTSKSNPACETGAGMNWEIVHTVSDANTFEVELKRAAVVPASSVDKDWLNGSNNVIWAYGTGSKATKHTGKGSTTWSLTLPQFSGLASTSNVLSAGNLEMKYGVNGADLHVQLKKIGAGWGAVGFGTSVMTGSDMLICDNNSGTITCKDCMATGQSNPPCTGESTDWTVVHTVADTSGFEIELKRPHTQTDNGMDYSFTNGSNNIIYAHGTGSSSSGHSGSNKGSSTISLTGLPNDAPNGGGGSSTPAFSTHASATSVLSAGELEFKYGINGSDIHIVIKRLKAGWGGVGFGSQSMNGADLIMCANNAGTVTCEDCLGVGNTAPSCSTDSMSWTVVHTVADAQGFEIELKRAAIATDTTNDLSFVNGDNHLIWAHGPGATNTPHSNSARGTQSISLTLTGLPGSPPGSGADLYLNMALTALISAVLTLMM